MKRIAQTQLITFANAHKALADAKKAAKKLETEFDAIEGPICQMLLAGHPIEKGPMTAVLKRHERRIVAWKKVVEEKLGKEEAERISAATEPSVSHEVVVSMQ